MIRVLIPSQLGSLTDAPREVELEVGDPVTLGRVMDALESAYPSLRGLLRDPATARRRPMIRFFVAEEDISHTALDAEIGEQLNGGKEPIWIVAAISGGASLPEDLDHGFTATIGVDVKGDLWSCVEMPGSAEFFGTGKSVKVDAMVDDIQLNNVGLMPTGKGGHMLSISAKLRKQLGKNMGDDVTVTLQRRLT